jgi:isopentenyl-diphosphate Delta-isomerase
MTLHPDTNDHVVLVDPDDNQIGWSTKVEAHEQGLLHRAVSVFIFDGHGRVLLQRRARSKYHSGARWSNTCCGHPLDGERPVDAAARRLRQEMGIACELKPIGRTTYRAPVSATMTEHEIDHVFIGWWRGTPAADPAEVDEWAWCTRPELVAMLHGSDVTPWLGVVWPIADRFLDSALDVDAASEPAGDRSSAPPSPSPVR